MKRERGFMDIDLFKKVMKELSPYLYNVNLYFQGEPMLHPQFFSFLGTLQQYLYSCFNKWSFFIGGEFRKDCKIGIK